MFDEILSGLGLKYEDLQKAERETLSQWTKDLEKGILTLEKVKDYIHSMRDVVEEELTKTSHNSKHDLFLKARLKNYLLLEAFLTSPDRAKKAFEESIKRLK